MPSLSNAYAVILAGGRGERFWPLSRAARPKQFIDLFGGKPLLRIAIDRLEGLLPPERILVITSRDLVEASRAAAPALPAANVLGEPVGRDTAAACALATELVAVRAGAGTGSATLAILTADHLIGNETVFRQTLADAFALAAAAPRIVTIGISPTHPATGFGYIEAAEALPAPGATAFHRVERFVEKPDADTAAGYVAGGRHYWNAGMFVWSVATFRDALREFRPSLAEAMVRLAPAIGSPQWDTALEQTYAGLERISVDYAVMERARNIAMARGAFDWDDVGSWPAVAHHFAADPAGNVLVGAAEALDARGNLVLSGGKHLVALYGVEDLVVVHTPDATLVCPRNRAQELKNLVRAVGARPDGAQYL